MMMLLSDGVCFWDWDGHGNGMGVLLRDWELRMGMGMGLALCDDGYCRTATIPLCMLLRWMMTETMDALHTHTHIHVPFSLFLLTSQL